MKKVLAKINRKNDSNVIVFSEEIKVEKIEKMFQPYSSELELKKYDPELPEEKDEYYYVNLSEKQFQTITEEYIISNDSSGELNNDGFSRDYMNITSLYLISDKKVLFKKINKSNFIHERGFIRVQSEPSFETAKNMISMSNSVDLILFKKEKKLLFRKFRIASWIVPVLKEFYRSATQEEVDKVLDKSVFNIGESFDTKKVGDLNRKKISLYLEHNELDLGKKSVQIKIDNYIKKYEKYDLVNLFDGKKFSIDNNADLTKVLQIVTGSFFENEITGKKMLAMSPKVLKNKIKNETKK
ncbi:MAG: hypothetical protein KAI16_02925 [Candidatus Pacebacteria bacterium]|nr:hypothetical protein [Candidatus Paceibacterota bacterium]